MTRKGKINMEPIIINGILCFYVKRENLPFEILGDFEEKYHTAFNTATFISEQLHIECPYIGLIDRIRNYDSMGRESIFGGVTYKKGAFQGLDNNLIILSLENFNRERFIAELAHEMRHIWQAKYYPEINHTHAIGFGESLNHPAEIDADGFAIWYMSHYCNMYVEKAASIVCPEEKKHYSKQFMLRIEKSKEIESDMSKKEDDCDTVVSTSQAKKRTPILQKLKSLFLPSSSKI